MSRWQPIKDYADKVILGIRNFHFFRISLVPKLTRAFSPIERKVFIVAACALVVTSSFLISEAYRGNTKDAPAFGGTYTEGLVGQPRFLNPVLSAANEVDRDITSIVYSGLYKFDAGQSLIPDLAATPPQISADQKTYIVPLKHDIVWHDGKPFGADDVVFTIQTIQNQAYQSPVRLNWSKVEVQKIDDFSVRFTLKEPSAPFLVNLTQRILPKHLWEKIEPANFALSKYNLQPIGTGPFEIKRLKKSEDGQIKSILLSAAPKFQPHRAYLDQIEFKFYQTYDDLIAAYHSKDILGLGYVPFDKKVYVEKSSRINLYYINMPRYQALFLNRNKSGVLAEKAVRKALVEGLDRQEIIKEVYLGSAQPAFGPIPPNSLGYNSKIESNYPHDIGAAKAILAAAGWIKTEGTDVLQKTNKKIQTPLEFTITTDSFPLNVKTADLLKKQWETLGFKINLQILTLGELQQNYIHPRAYDALLFSENVGGDPDPFAFWHSSQRLDPGLNLAMFGSKESDQLIIEARTNSDPAYRANRYSRFQELVSDDIPAIFIANSLFVYGVNNKIRGINLNSITEQSQRFLDIADWYMKTRRVGK